MLSDTVKHELYRLERESGGGPNMPGFDILLSGAAAPCQKLYGCPY